MSTTREVAEGIAEQFTEADSYGAKLRRENLTDAIDKALQGERERAAQIVGRYKVSISGTKDCLTCTTLDFAAAAIREGKPQE